MATRIVTGVDFNGGDIQTISNSSLEDCIAAVDNSNRFIFGTYNRQNRNCFLKSSNVTPVSNTIAEGIIHVDP